MYTYN